MAKQSLSLKTYLTFARSRRAGDAGVDRPARPDGPLIWAHTDHTESGRALASLCTRITQQRQNVGLLMTGKGSSGLTDTLPPDTVPDAQDFVDHWAPDICLWASSNLHPALIFTAASRGCRLAMVGATDRGWTTPAPRWLPDAAPPTLQHFDMLFVAGDTAERALRRMGLPADRLRHSGPLFEATLPLGCPRLLHQEMAEHFAGRPIWLAARVQPGEVDIILRAHRSASRLTHRLLLILVPANPGDAAEIAGETAKSGFRVANWDDGDFPDENAQILLTPGPEDLGLWYRLAPLSFIGGSLVAGHGGNDPLEAAALGSAVLYGPNIGAHLTAYTRLVDAGAARIVRDVDTLSAAVSRLIAPDEAATMAHAGWEVVSAGAEMTDLVVDQVLDWLDRLRVT